jgi:hypothetical protein
MKIENNFLYLDQEDVIKILENNPDKTSSDIDKKLLGLVRKYFYTITKKQEKWLKEKIGYIIRHNNLFNDYKKKSIELIKGEEGEDDVK